MRCSMRLAPLGAPTCTTRSTSPQSMPRSRVEVQTTACSLPATMALSTLRRCSTASEPWCSAMARPSSLMRPEVLEQHLGLLAGVDEEQRGAVLLDDLVELGDGVERSSGRPTARAPREARIETSGRAPALPNSRSVCASGSGAAIQSRSRSGRATVARQRRDAELRRVGRDTGDIERQQLAALVGDHRVQLVENDAAQVARRCVALSSWLSSKASCSGVVIRMLGGSRRWRVRREAGVSPVRVSTVIGSPISAIGVSRLRATSTASALSGDI